MRELYLYSEKKFNNIFKEMFNNFELHTISLEKIKKNNFINQNILLLISEDLLAQFNSAFFLNNNIVIFCKSKNNINKKNFFGAKIFNRHININKFIDEVTTAFVKSSLSYKDIKILGEKIINNEVNKEAFLTSLEKDILVYLIEKNQTEKNFLLENVLKVKKDTETKTLESHLTRIRNKLLKIDSKLKILSKSNRVFLKL